MHSTLEVERGLPPGLWVPTAAESTDQYLKENFNHPNHDYEDIIDYGAFIVALALLGAESTGRICMMPTIQDFMEMFRAGYGLSPNSYMRQRGPYGGIHRLQLALNYYPRGYVPAADEVTQRLKWIKEYAYPLDQEGASADDIALYGLIEWGSKRRLLPSEPIVYGIFDGDTSKLRRSTGLEKRARQARYSHLDLYRFGAKVIREHNGPPEVEVLDDQYASEFTTKPYYAICAVFGSLTNFWREFDHVPKSGVVSPHELLNQGVIWAIQHKGEIIDTRRIESLSNDCLFHSKQAIRTHFAGVRNYRTKIAEAYKQYRRVERELVKQGVSKEVLLLTSRIYQTGPIFENRLRNNVQSLSALSAESSDADYVKRLMSTGLNLEDNVVYDMQLGDLRSSLRRLGINSRKGRRLIFSIIPRLNPDEAFAHKTSY